MDKHLIITLHGMGNVGDNWGQENIEIPLKTAYETYPTLIGTGDFNQRFSFKHINYNTYFEKNLKRKRDTQINLNNLSSRAENLINGFSEITEKIFKLHQLDLSDDKFWATHFGDVFLYLVDDHVREQVNTLIQYEITSSLNTFLQKTQGNGSFSIIAHSLGTAAVTTALQQLYTDDTSVLHKFGKFKTLMTVANVANLASVVSGEDVYHNEVRPSKSRLKGVCYHYINCWHDLDPFTLIKRFRPNPEEWDHTAGDDDWKGHIYIERPISAKHIRQKNVHSLTHYLSHPDIHLAFFEYQENDPSEGYLISDDERNKAVKKWEKDTLWNLLLAETKNAQGELKQHVRELEDFINEILQDNDIEDIVDTINVVKGEIEGLSDNVSDELTALKANLNKIIKNFMEK